MKVFALIRLDHGWNRQSISHLLSRCPFVGAGETIPSLGSRDTQSCRARNRSKELHLSPGLAFMHADK